MIMGMNPSIMRLMQLLGNRKNPIDDLLGNTDPSYNETDPGSSFHQETDEDRIRRLFSEETPGMKNYRNFVSKAPNRQDYQPGIGGRLLAILSGIGTDIQHGRGSGFGVAKALMDEPYREAVQDYKLKGQGLGDIAALDEKTLGRKIQGESAIENIKTRKAISDQTLQERRDVSNQASQDRANALEEKAKEATERSKDRSLDRQSRAEAAKEARDLREQIHQENMNIRRELSTPIKVQDPNNPGQTKLVSRSTGEEVGNAPLPAGDIGIVNSAHAVKLGVNTIRTLVDDPDVKKELGPLMGRGEKIWIAIGASKNPKLVKLKKSMDALEYTHSKIFGRTGKQLIDEIKKDFGNIEQNPVQFNSSLDALEQQADEYIQARTPSPVGETKVKGKKIKLKDGTEVTVE